MSKYWICTDQFDVDKDSFDGVLENLLVFRSNTDEVSLVRWPYILKWVFKVEWSNNYNLLALVYDLRL